MGFWSYLCQLLPKTSYTQAISQWNQDPSTLFHTCLAILLSLVVAGKFLASPATPDASSKDDDYSTDDDDNDEFLKAVNNGSTKPAEVQRLQRRFLPVFWLLRTAFWISGPYFYAAYASKHYTDGSPLSTATISYIFLTGFAAIAILGPLSGNWLDQYGRKRGTIVASVIYALGALSLRSNSLPVLFMGRAIGGLGTSLISAAPEAWIITAFQNSEKDPQSQYLRETFGTAFSMDSVVAIVAGKMAGFAASRRGPTAPFELSPFFLALAAGIAAYSWKENWSSIKSEDNKSSSKSAVGAASTSKSKGPTIREAIGILKADPKIFLVGAIQSLFESAMYIFVMIWPPALNESILAFYGNATTTPYGTIFSCFMASCMVGSTLFGKLSQRNVSIEASTAGLLAVATLSLAAATIIMSNRSKEHWSAGICLAGICGSFFLFELVVGFYFPSIGTLRSNYLPNSHRSVLMTLFGVPLNILVVTVFLFISKLGNIGAMGIASAALGLATACTLRLQQLDDQHRQDQAKEHWNSIKNQVKASIVVGTMKGAVDNSRRARRPRHRRSTFHGVHGERECNYWLQDEVGRPRHTRSSSMTF